MNDLIKKPIFKHLVFSMLCMVFVACQQPVDEKLLSKAQHIEETFKESIEVHDEVMPLMNEIGRMQTSILKSLDSVPAKDSLETEQRLRAVNDLKQSQEAMMMWMQNLSKAPEMERMKEFNHTQLDSISRIQEAQLADIKQVNQLMKRAIENGRRYSTE